MYHSPTFDQAFAYGPHNGFHAIGGMQSNALLFSVKFGPSQMYFTPQTPQLK